MSKISALVIPLLSIFKFLSWKILNIYKSRQNITINIHVLFKISTILNSWTVLFLLCLYSFPCRLKQISDIFNLFLNILRSISKKRRICLLY